MMKTLPFSLPPMRLARPATPRWFQFVLAIFSLCFAASPPAFAAAFTYTDTDLLLVFRKAAATNDVIYNLGSISNYLGQANGASWTVNSFDFSRVTNVFGSDLTGVKYVLMAATTPSDSLLRAWLSDADSSGVPTDETHSLWSKQWAKIDGVGSRAATYSPPDATNQSLSIAVSDPNSYDSIVGGGLDVTTMGGSAPFTVEQDLGMGIRLYELKVSTSSPKPVAAQVGHFTMADDGGLSFVAGYVVPSIGAGPSNQTIECGSTATFTVSASGDEPLGYQWQSGGSDIPSANGTSYTTGIAGSYTVVVSNGGGSVTSAPAVLTLVDTTPPVVTVPANITVTQTSGSGATVNFSASASDVCVGAVSPACVPASGSTFAKGTTTVTCTADDGHGNTNSASFTITVKAGFTCTDTDLLLVFRKDGASNNVIFNLGGISNYLGLANGTALPVNSFDLSRVTAFFGSDLTGVKYVLMAATTPSDALLRSWLSDADASGVASDETHSLWSKQWAKIDGVGSRAASYFFPDATNQSLSIAASDPNSYDAIAGGGLDVTTMGGSAPFTVEQMVGSGIRLYELKVSTSNPKPVAAQVGHFAMANDGSLSFVAGYVVPGIVTGPSNQTIECGSTTTFTVSASGDEPLGYQWRLGGPDIPSANGTSYTTGIGGSYTVVVSNGGGSVTSAPAVLTVVDTTPPVVTVPANITVTQTSGSGATVSFSASASDVCVGAVSPACVPASGSTFAKGTTTVTCTADDGHGNTNSAGFTITVKAGFTYTDTDLLLVFRKDGASNNVIFNLGGISNYLGLANGTALPVNSFDLSRVTAFFGSDLTGVKYVLMAATTPSDALLRSWLSDADASGVASDETHSLWSKQWAKIDGVGSRAASYFFPDATNQSLSIAASDPNSYDAIAGGGLDVTTMGGSAPFTVEQMVGSGIRLYELKVSTSNPKPVAAQVGHFAMANDGSLSFVAGYVVPGIVTGPSNQTIECGSTTTFTVSASGDEPLGYQWRLGGSDIPSANGTSYTTGIGGSYTVVVSNGGGSVTSAPAVLTVVDTTPPVVTVPANITVTQTSGSGATVSFSASANDVCVVALTPTCNPPSGSTFPKGVTTVTCSANDGSNTGSSSFTVTVKAGFTYTDTDLLLVFRKDGASNNVVFNLGGISNYLGLANGTALPVNSFDLSRVTAFFGSDLTGVKYVLMAATTPSDALLRSWLSDADASGVASDETHSLWSKQWAKIDGVGSRAASYFFPDATNQSLSIAASDPNSYDAIAGGGLDVTTMGGSAPFTVEQMVGSGIRLYELKVSTSNPKPVAAQVGHFAMANDGSLSFVAGYVVPGIVTGPSNQTIECGVGSATFTVTASGDEPLAYQWRRNGTDIPNANSSSYTTSTAGSYTVVVSNGGGAATNTNPALLTVVDTTPPVLSVPANITVTATSSAGAVVSFSASANDTCVGALTPACTPPSGSTFAKGTTTVTCTADDGHGNTNSAGFTITVNAGFTYSDTDLLLVFRKAGASNNVIFDIGGISNYLGQANGTMFTVGGFDFNRVTNFFGTDLTGVKYVLMAATTPSDSALRAWLSDADSSGVPTDETHSLWSKQWAKINGVGSRAAAYFFPDATNQSLSIAASDPNSYDSIAGGGLDITTMGGSAPFTVEQDLGSSIRLYELKVSTSNPKPIAAQVGRFSLSGGGTLTFTANLPPVAVDDGATTLENQAIAISTAHLLANDSDPDLDPLTVISVSATSTNGGTVALSSGTVTYTPVAGFAGVDRFSYTISDGRTGTATAQVYVFVSDGPLPQPNGLVIASSGGGFRVRFAGMPGTAYDIQRAPEFNGPWTTITTATAPTWGIIQAFDPSPFPNRTFYRAVTH